MTAQTQERLVVRRGTGEGPNRTHVYTEPLYRGGEHRRGEASMSESEPMIDTEIQRLIAGVFLPKVDFTKKRLSEYGLNVVRLDKIDKAPEPAFLRPIQARIEVSGGQVTLKEISSDLHIDTKHVFGGMTFDNLFTPNQLKILGDLQGRMVGAALLPNGGLYPELITLPLTPTPNEVDNLALDSLIELQGGLVYANSRVAKIRTGDSDFHEVETRGMRILFNGGEFLGDIDITGRKAQTSNMISIIAVKDQKSRLLLDNGAAYWLFPESDREESLRRIDTQKGNHRRRIFS